MPQAAIIGEPTSMKLVNAHKGVTIFETIVTGIPGHSSQTHNGVNAIDIATDCISFLKTKAEQYSSEGSRDERLEPPYNTINVSMIDGGTALNIIPGECKFTWDCRSIGSVDANLLFEEFERYCRFELLEQLKGVSEDISIETKVSANIPPLTATNDNPAEALVRRLTGQNQALGVAFAAEAGLFQQAEIPSVICGPGSVDQAHQPNEFVKIVQIEECADFIRKIAQWAADEHEVQRV
jgi:acetylornithine deacetylase